MSDARLGLGVKGLVGVDGGVYLNHPQPGGQAKGRWSQPSGPSQVPSPGRAALPASAPAASWAPSLGRGAEGVVRGPLFPFSGIKKKEEEKKRHPPFCQPWLGAGWLKGGGLQANTGSSAHRGGGWCTRRLVLCKLSCRVVLLCVVRYAQIKLRPLGSQNPTQDAVRRTSKVSKHSTAATL